MGFLLDDILFFPVKGFWWISGKIKESAEAEFFDESKARESLLALQMRFEAGELSEEDYILEESLILKRLDDIRRYKEERNGER